MTARAILLCGVTLLCLGCGRRNADTAAEFSGLVVPVTDLLLASGIADTLDMGKLYPGESVGRTIQLRNDSDRPMVILGVDSSCGCIEVDYPRDPVMTGKTASVTFRFHTSSLDSGWQFKPVSLRTSLGSGRYRVIVTAEVADK